MSNQNNGTDQDINPVSENETPRQDFIDRDFSELVTRKVPAGSDRRAFMMRTAIAGAIAAATGCTPTSTTTEQTPAKDPVVASTPPLSPDLEVVKKEKGPVMTTI